MIVIFDLCNRNTFGPKINECMYKGGSIFIFFEFQIHNLSYILMHSYTILSINYERSIKKIKPKNKKKTNTKTKRL